VWNVISYVPSINENPFFTSRKGKIGGFLCIFLHSFLHKIKALWMYTTLKKHSL
jgi:hypothetical protein